MDKKGIQSSPATPFTRFVRLPAVEQMLGLKRTQIFEHIAKGEMPRPVKLAPSGRAIGWDLAELERYCEERRAERDKKVEQR